MGEIVILLLRKRQKLHAEQKLIRASVSGHRKLRKVKLDSWNVSSKLHDGDGMNSAIAYKKLSYRTETALQGRSVLARLRVVHVVHKIYV